MDEPESDVGQAPDRHVPVAMTAKTIRCSCGLTMRLDQEYEDCSKTIRDNNLLDTHAAHVQACKEAGR